MSIDQRLAQARANKHELEANVRVEGRLNDELDALATAADELADTRHDIAEAIGIALYVQGEFSGMLNHVSELEPQEDDEGSGLWSMLTGERSRLLGELGSMIARAHQGLRRFEQACRAFPQIAPYGVQLELSELPYVDRLIFGVGVSTLAAVRPAIGEASSSLSAAVGALRNRDRDVARAQKECADARARLLDPSATSPYR